MGGIDDQPGAWAYPEGGMGAVSDAIASSAKELGAQIFTSMVSRHL
jgi:phytoene dehydrogenase-like protein